MSRKRRRRSSPAPVLAIGLLLLAAAVLVVRLRPGRYHVRPERAARAAGGAVLPNTFRPGPRRPDRVRRRRAAATVTARIYFRRIVGEEERMTAVERPVSAESPAREALLALLSGATPTGYQHPLPVGVKLRSVKVEGGLATADFSRELISGFQGGSDNEGVTVYAIVDTLCSVPGVKEVQILVEGQRVDSLGGHLDISGPLTADAELVVPGGER